MTATGLLVDVVIALATGAGLWAILPRGVVLTVEPPDTTGLPDTWRARNSSPVPIAIRSITATGLSMLTPDMELDRKDVPTRGLEGAAAVSYDHPGDEVRRLDKQRPWKGLIVKPGDSIRVWVMVNHSVTIEYRRAGWTGLFERRQIIIEGFS